MPVYRDKDGNIVEEPTDLEKTPAGGETDFPPERKRNSDETVVGGSRAPGKSAGGKSGEAVPTVPLDGSGGSAPTKGREPFGGSGSSGGSAPPAGGAETTRLMGAPSRSGKTAESRGPSFESPVVGWLVIVKGPGRGKSLPLGYGRNSIGRAATERISVDFGDRNISRANHASVTYDPRGRKFYINGGEGSNLTYLGEKPVLAPEVLEPLADIGVGETVLRFVPFCGEDFEWQDEE